MDGRTLTRAEYPELFEVYRSRNPAQFDNTTEIFQIDDARGRFLRPLSNGSGVDPNAATRPLGVAAGVPGGPGSTQSDAMATHSHGLSHSLMGQNEARPNTGLNSNRLTVRVWGSGIPFFNIGVGGVSGTATSSETRPTNIGYHAIILTTSASVEDEARDTLISEQREAIENLTARLQETRVELAQYANQIQVVRDATIGNGDSGTTAGSSDSTALIVACGALVLSAVCLAVAAFVIMQNKRGSAMNHSGVYAPNVHGQNAPSYDPYEKTTASPPTVFYDVVSEPPIPMTATHLSDEAYVAMNETPTSR